MRKFKFLPKIILLPLVAMLSFSCSQEKEADRPENPKLDKLKLPSGFTAEHLYSPGENEQGSWVAMAFDDKGRLITADQYGA